MDDKPKNTKSVALDTEALIAFMKKKSSMLGWAFDTMSVQDMMQAYVVACVKYGFDHARAYDYVSELEARLKATYDEGVEQGYDEGYNEGLEEGRDSYDGDYDDDEEDDDYKD